MENYTNPETTDLQNPQDLLNACLLFARALGLILQENQGIVVDVAGDVNMGPDVKKVIVFKNEDKVHIYRCEDDLNEGTSVMMSQDTPEVEEKN